MTDNEIIKALECCTNDDAHCRECPYDCTGTIRKHCSDVLAEDAISLINRQKAELDDLKRDDLPRCKDALRRANEIGMALEKENQELKEKIEYLNGVITTTAECAYESRQMAMKWARAEAIKEFAQDLKEALYFTEFGTPVVDVSDIDDFVKEMVGDDNENL